jgi:hypothetical protein
MNVDLVGGLIQEVLPEEPVDRLARGGRELGGVGDDEADVTEQGAAEGQSGGDDRELLATILEVDDGHRADPGQRQ